MRSAAGGYVRLPGHSVIIYGPGPARANGGDEVDQSIENSESHPLDVPSGIAHRDTSILAADEGV